MISVQLQDACGSWRMGEYLTLSLKLQSNKSNEIISINENKLLFSISWHYKMNKVLKKKQANVKSMLNNQNYTKLLHRIINHLMKVWYIKIQLLIEGIKKKLKLFWGKKSYITVQNENKNTPNKKLQPQLFSITVPM